MHTKRREVADGRVRIGLDSLATDEALPRLEARIHCRARERRRWPRRTAGVYQGAKPQRTWVEPERLLVLIEAGGSRMRPLLATLAGAGPRLGEAISLDMARTTTRAPAALLTAAAFVE